MVAASEGVLLPSAELLLAAVPPTAELLPAAVPLTAVLLPAAVPPTAVPLTAAEDIPLDGTDAGTGLLPKQWKENEN